MSMSGGTETKLSAVILTYRRDDALVPTLARLYERLAGRDDCLVILVDNNADGIDRSSMLAAFPNSAYVPMETNAGVTGGRNAGIERAQGEVILFLDDDALVETEGDLAEKLLREFSKDRDLGVLAFRSFVGHDRHDDPAEFPHTDKSRPRDRAMGTFRFIGVAHAMRLSDLRSAGPYREEFFYGMEEFDMSFRFLKAGRRIVYDPAFAVNHLKSPAGRLPRADVAERMFLNKLRVAWMHLPAPEFALCCAAWAVKTTLDTRSPRAAASAFRDFIAWVRDSPGVRKPAPPEVIGRVEALGGVPWK